MNSRRKHLRRIVNLPHERFGRTVKFVHLEVIRRRSEMVVELDFKAHHCFVLAKAKKSLG